MRTRTVARCQACGARAPRWVGRCAECGEWGSVVEETASANAQALPVPVGTVRLSDHAEAGEPLLPTGSEEVDRVLGGGLVPRSVVLLAGEPGVGKSTITLQIATRIAARDDVLLVCGEESPGQVRARAARIGEIPSRIRTLADPSLPAVLGAVRSDDALVVVDSIQTVFDPEIASAPGSVAQVRECGARLARLARETGPTVVLVGHVTKDGSVAGPRVLEHLVDAVVTFEGDASGAVRILRGIKNRFGPTHDPGFFEMTADGLRPIRDASAYLLADRCAGLPGSVLAAAMDGRRPFVCEIQALVCGEGLHSPRRVAQGVDPGRLPIVVAVLERRLGVKLHDKEVYVSAVGGFRASEPATDLPVALAVISAVHGRSLPPGLVAFGEIGLAGEVRRAPAADRRLAEARSVGCDMAAVPATLDAWPGPIRRVPLRHLSDAQDLVTA